MKQALEIACDESGYEGEKLIGATTEVFAHASVHIPAPQAAAAVQELRARILSPATEYKATHLLREKHREVLRWFLGPQGPVHGRAHVYLIDKPFYILGKVTRLLVREPEAQAVCGALYREGPRVFSAEKWEAFLTAANGLMRTKERVPAVHTFYRAVDDLRGGPLDRHLQALELARPRAEAYRAGLLENPDLLSAVDPLVPALVRAVAHWGGEGVPVTIVHDRQTTLSETRIAQLKVLIPEPHTLAGLEHVDSFFDARVQLADIVAGVARKMAEDALTDRGAAGLAPTMLRPYVDSHSVWGDERSWALLEPAAGLGQQTGLL